MRKTGQQVKDRLQAANEAWAEAVRQRSATESTKQIDQSQAKTISPTLSFKQHNE